MSLYPYGCYNGPYRQSCGVHYPISRKRLATMLRIARSTFNEGRQEAIEFRNYLIYLGTYPTSARYMQRKYGVGITE